MTHANTIKPATLANIHKNCLGTISFTMQAAPMRKAQEFITYPIKSGEKTNYLHCQSDNRFMLVQIATGKALLSKSYPHAMAQHALHDALPAMIAPDDLALLLAAIRNTANGKAGLAENGIVFTDNAGAALV